MLGVIITLLKIIGILLLIVVLLVLFALFAVLFVPVRYEVILSFAHGKLNGKVSAHWLLRLVHIKLLIADNKRTILLCIAGIDLKKRKQKKEARQSRGKEKRKKEKKGESRNQITLSDERMADDFSEMDSEGRMHEQEKRLLEDALHEKGYPMTEDFETQFRESAAEQKFEKETAVKQSLSERFSMFLNKLRVLWDHILNLLKTVGDKKKWVSSLLEELSEEPMKKSIGNLKVNLLKAIIHILPYKGNVNLEFGFENPAITGQVLGILAMVYPYFRGNLSITPYFGEKILKGDFSLKGRIRAANLLLIVLRVWRDKDLKAFIKKIKNGNHGGM